LKHYRILFVERHRSLQQSLLPALAQRYEVMLAHGRREAMLVLDSQEPDLVLLDVASVRFDIGRFCDDLKAYNPGQLLFILVGKGMRLDKLPKAHGFLRHPVTARQLQRRLSRLLPEHGGEIVAWKGLQLDIISYALIWETDSVFLTPKQADLFLAFLRTPGKVLSRAWLMQEIWGTDYLGDTRTLDVHIHWLRKALASLGEPFCLRTKRGEGYQLVDI